MSYINKPGKNTAWRKSVINNLVADVILYEKIETCSSMTKSLTKLLAKLITWAKKAEVQEAKNKQHFYRLALRYLVNKKNIMTNDSNKEKLSVINKLFTDLGKRYQERQGGYSRITKLKLRRGDNNLRVIFSLV